MTQESLAAKAEVSAKFIGLVERCETNVSISVLAQLSVDGLGVPLDRFFTPDDGPAGPDADVAAVTAVVAAQPPALRRLGLRLLRSLYGGVGDILEGKSRRT